MRRVIALLAALVLALPATLASAQNPAAWVRTYPERSQPACTWIVAQWSDGTYSASAWECDPGQAAVRADGATATRGYPQVADNLCVEYVSQWSDLSYSWVPYVCPPGVVYPKDKSRGVQPRPGGSATSMPQQPAVPQQPSPAQPTTGRQGAVVSAIIDGDTIDVVLAGSGAPERVRLLGIDAPATTGTIECYGIEAANQLVRLIPLGTPVELERDVNDRSSEGLLLRYVFAGGRLINEVMVAEGAAVVSSNPPDVKYLANLVNAQNQARGANKGIWATCNVQAPALPFQSRASARPVT